MPIFIEFIVIFNELLLKTFRSSNWTAGTKVSIMYFLTVTQFVRKVFWLILNILKKYFFICINLFS